MFFHESWRAFVRAVVCFGVLVATCHGQSPAVSLSPTSLTFASQLVGTPSPAQTITLTNTGNASLSITKISITGTNVRDYSQTNNCGKSVAAGASCTVNVTFTPVAKGTRTANVSFTDNAAGSPQSVPLTGTGIAPFVKLTPTSLTFSGQQVGTTSAAQNVTLKNTGTATLTITSIAASGDFAQTNTCGSTVAVSATCTITVTFTPTAEGTRTGSVSVTDNATGSPQSVSLTGTGLAALVSLSPTNLTFSSQTVGTTSSPQSVTLTNTGNESLSVTSIGASGDYAQTNTCGTSLGAGANCTVSVTFTPTTTGTRTGTVTITDSASDSPQTVSLSGTGTSAAVTPTLTVLGPGPRIRHSAVLDAATNSMIIFGGQKTGINNFNDVWQSVFFEDTTVNYVPMSPSGTAPAARYGHTGVYDATNSRMMIFGGALGVSAPAPCQNDMWVLQNANGVSGTPTWTQLTLSGGPIARYGHTSVYDPNTNAMIVFGGSDCAAGLFNDVWVLSNANGTGGTPVWTQLSPSGSAPSGREAASAIYDPTTNVMVVFGGDQGSSTTLGDVWVLSSANGTGGAPTWTQLFPTGTAPSARTGHSAVYDSANNRMIMYGGVLANGTVVADTWILTGANGQSGTPAWSLLTVTNGTAKAYHSAVYNPATNEMTVFAGEIAVVPSDDHIFTLFNANGLP